MKELISALRLELVNDLTSLINREIKTSLRNGTHYAEISMSPEDYNRCREYLNITQLTHRYWDRSRKLNILVRDSRFELWYLDSSILDRVVHPQSLVLGYRSRVISEIKGVTLALV